MILPHQARFPIRHTIFGIGCAAGFVSGLVWPGLTIGQRSLNLVAAFYGVANAYLMYGMLLMLLRCIPLVHTAVALVIFYVALGIAVVVPIDAVHGLIYDPDTDRVQRAIEFCVQFCGSFGVMAVAHKEINRRQFGDDEMQER